MSNAPGNRGEIQGGADGVRPPSSEAHPASWSDALAAADAISALLAHPVDIEERGLAIVVKAAGPHLGQRECPAIIDAAQAAFVKAHGRKFAVLDLGDVQVFSAMGVGLCTDFAKRAKERKLTPVLFGLRGDLLNQLRMFKIERLFTVVRSKGDLEQLLRGS